MIGHGEGDARAGVESALQHGSIEGLRDRIRGDETEAGDFPFRHQLGGVAGPIHHEVHGLGHARPRFAHGFHIAVAEREAHPFVADEGRIADDEIRVGPFGGARVFVVERRDARGFIGHVLASDGMLFHRPPIPTRDGLALLVEHGLGAVVGEDGVAVLDVVEVLDDGLGRGDAAAGAEVPLEVADPQDQLGDGGGARVHLQAEELVRIDGEAGHFQRSLLVAEPVEGVEDFAFEALEVLQGDVEEIAGAARGVEDAHFAEAAVEALHFGGGFLRFALAVEGDGGGLGGVPLGAQRLDDGGHDEALDVGARGVVRAELVALDGIERALQQGAEDGGLDIAPVGARRLDEQLKLVVGEREGGGVLEEAAIEVAHFFAEHGGEAAGLHAAPQFLDHRHELVGVAVEALEQVDEAVLRQQLDVFRKHGEERAHEEGGDGFRAVAALFQRSGEASEALRDLAGDAGAASRGVERLRVGPREAERLAHVGVAQPGEQDAVALRIGERDVGAAGTGELGVEFDTVANIDDDKQRRTAFAGGQRAGVLLGLAAGLEHGFIPRRAAALSVAFLRGFRLCLRGVGKGLGGFAFFHSLLRFEDVAAAFVEVDAPGARGAVRVMKGDAALENVGVVRVVRFGRVRPRDAEQVAQLGKEELVIRTLRRAG
jgi:hypothetical protein